MNTNQDEKWQSLLALSAPTFAGESTPPFGFVTGVVARLKAENKEQELFERIGLRAIFAALGTLAVAAALSITVHQHMKQQFDPGEGSLIEVENFPTS